MKRKATALILIWVLLLSVVAGAQFFKTKAEILNPVVGNARVHPIQILTPQSFMNYTNPIVLAFYVSIGSMFGAIGIAGISIDNGDVNSETLHIVSKEGIYGAYDILANCIVTLPTLSEGNHKVTVYYGHQEQGTYYILGLGSVAFGVVDDNASDVNTAGSDIASYINPRISISSPLNNTSFNASSLSLNYTVSYGYLQVTSVSASYSIDRKDKITISSDNGSKTNTDERRKTTSYSLEVGNLSDGLHNLTVYSDINYYAPFSSYGVTSTSVSIQFTVDTSPPVISGLSILNKTYNSQDIPLSFSFNENTSWVAYNLDNQGNVTWQGKNMNLTGLSEGSHSLVVYANDTLGNMGKSDTVFFTVNTASIEDFIPLIVLSGVIVIVVAVGLFVYFKKRKR